MHGYFKLVTTDKGTGIKVFAPTDGSEALKTDDVRAYLDDRKIQYDSILINDAVTNATGEVVLFTQAKLMPERESYKLYVSNDRMLVTAFFYAPSEGGVLMTYEEMLHDLEVRKIVFGVNKENIKAFFDNRDYCKDIVIAEGKPTREGHDAKVEYKFNTNLRARPTLNPDGSVDYFHLNLINNVNQGDELAVLIPEDRGDFGTNVHGDMIKPHTVKTAHIKYGKNTVLSEDKMSLTAEASGHVTLKDGKVTVSNVLTLQDVGVGTGNIDYDGSVEVKGIVETGFVVKAGGNIVVKGIVEGAILESGADIILERGINGMGRGQIKADGNIVAKFMENATVSAKGSITAETIMHSNVASGTEINVTGKKGFIAGGKVSAADKVEAKILGSEMGANTLVEVGADPTIKVRMKELQKNIATSQKTLESIKPTLAGVTKLLKSGAKLSPEQAKYTQQLLLLNKKLNEQIEVESDEYCELQEKLSEAKEAEVIVQGTAYPGTTVNIGELSMIVKKPVQYSRFVIKDGDVRLAPI